MVEPGRRQVIGSDPAFTSIAGRGRLAHVLEDGGTLTIASGVVTITGESVYYKIDTESAAATDDLDTITIMGETSFPRLIVLQTVDNGRDVTVKHGTGNIVGSIAADYALSGVHRTLFLVWDPDESQWAFLDPAEGAGGGGGAPVDAEYVVVSLNATLTAERRLQVGSGMGLTDAGANDDLTVDIDTHTADANAHHIPTVDSHLDAYNGSFLEPFTFVVTESGGVITGTLDKNPSGDLTERFSDGYSTVSSGTTVTLTAGTDTAPVKNFVYILQSNKGVLVVSTSDWPAAEHNRIAEVILQSAAKTQSEGGGLVNRNWNDYAKGTDGQGHHLHAWERMRFEHSAWKSGVAITWTVTVNAGVPDNIDLAVTAGKIYQLHLQGFEAKNTAAADNVHVVNDNTTPYTEITDFADLLTDSAGVSMAGRYFNLVVWASVSSGSEIEHLFVNLPSGSYNKQGDAIADVSGYTNFNIPPAFRGQAFLITRIALRHQAASGGTWTSIQETDLRGQIPNIVAGGGTAAITTEFADSQFRIFDDGDPTKELAFQLSGLSTSTLRTITMPDADVTLLNKAAAEAITGLWNFIASGLGGLADYDLTVGDVVTPDYGLIRIGDGLIGRTSYKVGALDLDGAFIFRNVGGPVTSQIEFVFTESGGGAIRFALPKSGVGNATYNPRSMLIAGPAVNDDDVVTVGYWQGQGIFHNLLCDTSGFGADLGVQNDLEVENDIYTDSIKESTPGAGVDIGAAVVEVKELNIDGTAAGDIKLKLLAGFGLAVRAGDDSDYAPMLPGNVFAQGTFAMNNDVSPAQITANQDDYNPTGLVSAGVLRLNSDAGRNITGLDTGADGRWVSIHNVGSFDIVLTNEDVASSAENRFQFSDDITLAAGDACLLQYDSTSNRWRAIGSSPGGAGGGAQDVALLDGSEHNDTAAGAAARGAMIAGDAAGAWAVLAKPASGNHVLVHDGTDASWDDTPTVEKIQIAANDGGTEVLALIAPTTTGVVNWQGLSVNPSLTFSGNNRVADAIFGQAVAFGPSAGSGEKLRGLSFIAIAESNDVTTGFSELFGAQVHAKGFAIFASAALTIDEQIGLRVINSWQEAISGVINATTVMGVHIPTPQTALGTPTVTDYFGLMIETWAVAANNYLIWAERSAGNASLRLDAGNPPDAASATEGDSAMWLAWMENGAVTSRRVRWEDSGAAGGAGLSANRKVLFAA